MLRQQFIVRTVLLQHSKTPLSENNIRRNHLAPKFYYCNTGFSYELFVLLDRIIIFITPLIM